MIIIPNGGLNMNEFKNKEIKSAYIYTRVSTEEQTQGFSLEAQADDIKNTVNITILPLRVNTAMQESLELVLKKEKILSKCFEILKLIKTI